MTMLFILSLLAVVKACLDDDDCELNGMCSASGKCVCNPGWHGVQCGELILQPVNADAIGLVGNASSSSISSSWGGSIIPPRNASDQWHLVAAAMINHCGIRAWSSNSEVIHAVSNHPEGPYAVSSTLMPRFAHEPNVVVAEDGKTLVMFFTGNRGVSPKEPQNCTAPTSWPWQRTATTASESDDTPISGTPPIHFPSGYMNTWMTWAPNAEGPWSVPVALSVGTACRGVPDGADTNLAGAILPDGSMFGLWRCVETLNSTRPDATVLHVVRADHWRLPETYRFSSMPAFPQQGFGTEDPFVWWRPRDATFHAVVHDEQGAARATAIGRHAWSHDGELWRISTGPYAYNGTVAFADGVTRTLARRERPHLLLSDDPDRRPLALSNGVSIDGGASFTLIQRVNINVDGRVFV